ncbi:MAG: hypothetical protein ASARMPREDX12_006146 [Alectoria sarmentosa]|nr:MAG: hypothetical protein ASARMPREDX12_006146 [Alectoria sarmentosa]
MVSYASRKYRADIYVHQSTVHDIKNLKAVCDLSAAGARTKEVEHLAKLSPTELKDPVAASHQTRPGLLHHDFGANDDTLDSSLSPPNLSSSQTSIHTEVFSPTPRHAGVPANTTPSILGHEPCQIFDQERRSISNSSILNPSSHAEAVSNTTSSSLGDESCQIFDQERCSSSYSPLSLPNTSSFWPVEDATQMPLDHHNHCAPIVPSNINEIAADDNIMSTSYDWANFPVDLFQLAPSSTHGGSNVTADLPLDSIQPAPSSTHGESKSTPQDGVEKIILPNNDFMPSSSYPSSQSGVGHEPQNDVRLGAKRMKKLDTLLEMLQTASLPDISEHNEIVNEIRELCRKGSFPHRRVASGSFSADLEEPTASSSAAKFAYDLLSWEKYRQEEKRLIWEEEFSSISASKEVNARMMKARRRQSKTRDWASDGRKAAKMFFDALHNRNTADRSFALLLLASNVSLDQMLKIAHFPTLRSSFASRFARLVEKKAEGWSTMSNIGFAVLNVAQVVSD